MDGDSRHFTFKSEAASQKVSELVYLTVSDVKSLIYTTELKRILIILV